MVNIKDEYQRVYAEINLDALNYNMDGILAKVNDKSRVIAVLKTDAYGHGAIPIARELETRSKVYGYALATAEEALILRNSGIRKPLIILGYTFPNKYEELIQKNITMTAFREDMLEEIAKACRHISTTEYKYVAHIHIKIDTGMGRIGITPDEKGIDFIKKALEYEEIKIDGIFTHLAKADEDKDFTLNQLQIFSSFVNKVEMETGYKIPLKHALNSAGLVEYPEYDMDLVRAGIILYGLWPDSKPLNGIDLKPVLSLRSQIVYVKKVAAGTSISYGGTYICENEMKIATVPVGYGEGYPRLLSNKASVLVKGQRCAILGRICMDQFMIDVTNVDGVKEGDVVTLIGSDGDDNISMEELGNISGRFNYEMACDLGKRIPRVFIKNKLILTTKDYYEDF